MTNHIKIKSSLILLTSIITMVLIAYTMIRSHIEFRDTMVVQAQQQLLTIAETTANNVENYIFMPSVALNKAASLTIQAASNEQSTTNNSLRKELPLQTFSLIYGKGLEAVFILDLTGKIILSHSPVTEIAKVTELEKLDTYAIDSALKSHRTYIGTAFFNENEELTISITEPILNDQKILIGLTQRILNINYLTRTLIKPIQSQGAKRTWMFDQRKVILSHPNSDYIGLSISDIIRKLHESSGEHFHSHELKEHISEDHGYFDKVLVKEQGTGIFKSCSSFNKELVAYHTIKIGDKRWGLVVTLPYNEIAGPVTEHGKRVFGLAFLTIIILYTGSVIIFQGKKRRSELEKEAIYLKNLAKSAQKLREEEQRFRDLVENSPMGIIIKHNNTIAYRNPEQERLFGETSNEFLEMNTIHPDDTEKFSQFIDQIESGKSITADTEIRFYPNRKDNKESELRWTHCRAGTIQYQSQQCLLLNIMDITRTKELEHLMMMKQKMVSLGHVAAGIAHEIRNPLSGINLLLSALKKTFQDLSINDEEKNKKISSIFSQLSSASSRIESVIRRVMDFAKPSMPRLIPTDINQALKQVLELSSVTLKKSGIELKEKLQKDLPLCKADSHLIGQVILNLVTNAAQAMKNTTEQKIIEISTHTMDNQFIILVSDSGPGISPSVRAKIFDPFFTTKSDSSGIGLSLSHRIITDHGGNLSVTESQWGGACFIIELPLPPNQIR